MIFSNYLAPQLPSPFSAFSRPVVMGVLNVTPDSFYEPSRPATLPAIIELALAMQADGADCIDIGGESTRPGAPFVSVQEEIDRVIPVIEALKSQLHIPISLDSRRAEVMAAGISAGVSLLNSQDALEDPGARSVAAQSGLAVVLMHQSTRPAVMSYAESSDPHHDVVAEVENYFKDRIALVVAAGVHPSKIIIDPGYSFGKTPVSGLKLIKGVPRLRALGCPVLLGVSRKSSIGALIGGVPPSERAAASLVADMVGALYGVSIIRTHDVKQAVHGLAVLSALKEI